MKFFNLFIGLLILSCQKYAEFESHEGVAYLKGFESKIDSVKVEDLHVGTGRSQTLSKGFLVQVELTPIEESAAEKLVKKYNIDSWVARIQKVDGAYNKEVGYCYNPFFTSHVRLGRSFIKITNISFRVNYAATLTKNMRSFQCPAHGHKLEITDSEIISRDFGSYTVSTNSGRTLQKPVERNEIVPPTFNGGLKLQGKYRVDLALYNSKDRKIYGDWIPSKGVIHIVYEKQKTISGCEGKGHQLSNESDDERRLPVNLLK